MALHAASVPDIKAALDKLLTDAQTVQAAISTAKLGLQGEKRRDDLRHGYTFRHDEVADHQLFAALHKIEAALDGFIRPLLEFKATKANAEKAEIGRLARLIDSK